ncbi:cryptococcal mannosyltransferase 1-domain-containing protein [Mrakia frigida]|uniref:glycosyltransferase family 69 protein n=1 Tax=Mrakia frigida TaxID=29902 RepID=UPI003FCBEEC7
MRLSKLHALLLLPPTLLLTAWFFSSSSSSTSTVPPSPGRSPSPLSFLQLDEDLSLLYRQLKLPKPVRVYPPELSDQQKRRFHGLRAPTATSSNSKREGQARRRYEEASEQLLGSRDDDEEEKDEQDQLYYLTSNLLNASPVLPDIITSLLVLADFLGPKHVYLSIVEGPSKDSTSTILNEILKPRLLQLGVPEDQISIRSMKNEDVDWNRGGGSGRGRIEVLAELRNKALEPLVRESGRRSWGPILFFNDVLFSAAHVLELLHRHAQNEATQTCAWDVLYNPPTLFTWHATLQFYDSWVARTLNGNTFFPVGPSKKDWKPELLFDPSSSPDGRERRAYESSNPFPVFSCFNGLTILSSLPFLPSSSSSSSLNPLVPPSIPGTPTPRRSPPLKFRTSSSSPGSPELNHSEAFLLSRDLWRRAVASNVDGGAARVQVVPGVKVAYEERGARMLRRLEEEEEEEGRVVGKEVGMGDGEERIDWKSVKGPRQILGFGWPEKGGVKGNPWLHGKWVDALWG